MKHFKELNNLPVYTDLLQQINQYDFVWRSNQVCINTAPGHESDTEYGVGSLVYDWKSSYTEQDEHGNDRVVVPEFAVPKQEQEFTKVCDVFRGTVFEHIYTELDKLYVLGRVRLMRSKSKTCLSWHQDTSTRIHYPIKTQEGCFMLIEDEVLHLKQHQWYYTNTLPKHTAFNASKEDRLHLVVVVLDER